MEVRYVKMNRSGSKFNKVEKALSEAEGSDYRNEGRRVTSYVSLNSDEIGRLKIVIQKKDEKISELNVILESKDKELSVLKAQMKKLEGEKLVLEARPQESQLADVLKDVAELREAKGNLEGKDLVFEEKIKDLKDDIKDLNEQITKLKAEKRCLQQQLKCLEKKHEDLRRKHEDLETKHVDLQTEVAKLEEKNSELEENVDYVTVKMNDMKERFQTENWNLKKEVGELKCDLHKVSDELTQLKSSEKAPLFILGQLCSQILSLMYKTVLPSYHDGKRNYQVEDIEKDIEALESEESKLAKEKWAELKETLNWKKKHSSAIRSIKATRNIAGHPSINEELLCKAANEAQDKGYLTDWKTLNNVKELIDIWKKLHEMH